MLTPPRQGVGQPGQAVSPHPRQPLGPSASPRRKQATASSNAPCAVRAAPRRICWFHHEAKSLLGGERLGRREPLQRQFRLAAIEMNHRIVQRGGYEAERVL